jgi:hypothetical protein
MQIRKPLCRLLFLGAVALHLSGSAVETRPVLVMLHSRFDDHVTFSAGEDRILRLISLIEKLRKEFPSSRINVSCEFSGAFVQQLARNATGRDYIATLKRLADAGAVDLGYIGENEPTYRNRPQARLESGMTPEQRWLAELAAAGQALDDYRHPYTGDRDSSRPGALRAFHEIFGNPVVLGRFAPTLGGEAPYFHRMRRDGVTAVMPGFMDPYFTMNIHGYRMSVSTLGKAMAVPDASSELLWDQNFLRASFTTTDDVRRYEADEGKDALAKEWGKLDRSRIRVLQIEIAGYSRYLARWPDGTPKLHPLVWAYDHPDDPEMPNGIKAYALTEPILKAYASEEEALRWILDSFLPANPGSRIVSARDLLRIARSPVGHEYSRAQLADAAKDWLARTSKEVNLAATFAQAGPNYFSAADLFQMLANALTLEGGTMPDRVRLTHINPPLTLEEADDYFPVAEIAVSEIAAVAAKLAPSLNDQTWRPVPSNAVPVRIEIAGKRLIPAQFLRLMAEAYLAPSPDSKIKLRYFQQPTAPGYYFPRQNGLRDAGHMWTLRPAPLDLH